MEGKNNRPKNDTFALVYWGTTLAAARRSHLKNTRTGGKTRAEHNGEGAHAEAERALQSRRRLLAGANESE